MRWLLHALFALAVFTTAGGGSSTLAGDCARASACKCDDQGGSGQSGAQSCCGGMQEASDAVAAPCSSQSARCGNSPKASLQFSLAQAVEGQAQAASNRTNSPEPKPWPLSWTVAPRQDAAGPSLSDGCPTPLWRLRSWAEASLPGRSALDHLSRLSIFRI